jgi:serine/threonine protein kinase
VVSCGAQVFAREVQLLASVQHPNVIELVAADRTAMQLITEFAAGGSLKEALSVGLCMSSRLSAMQQVADAMKHLHSLSPPVMHRNLKTTNILLCRDNIFKLSDFG